MQYAIVFAGQGAQAVGMGKDLAEGHPACRALFDQASAVLGFDLARLCFEGPIEELTKSNRCQPAIFTMSAACYALLRAECPNLAVGGVAGLSLGEWTALYAAGVLSFEDVVRILEARGRFMQAACEEQPGGMLSVLGLPSAELEKISAAAGVEIANLNSPEQTVLSGAKDRIAEADRLAQAAGAKRTVVLNVAGAFHSKLMSSAARELEAFLGPISFQAPRIPAVANVTGLPHDPAQIKQTMVKQVTSPVQWVRSIQWFQGAGMTQYVECGPGKILGGLIKRIDKSAVAYAIQDEASLKTTGAAIRGA